MDNKNFVLTSPTNIALPWYKFKRKNGAMPIYVIATIHDYTMDMTVDKNSWGKLQEKS